MRLAGVEGSKEEGGGAREVDAVAEPEAKGEAGGEANDAEGGWRDSTASEFSAWEKRREEGRELGRDAEEGRTGEPFEGY